MKIWITEIKAICPIDSEIKTFIGPSIIAPSRQLANEYCQNNGLGYCKIIGQLIAEIPCKKDTYYPDFNNMIDYDNIQSN